MPLLTFGDFKPDVSDYEAASSRNILNAFPQGDGYGPVRSQSEMGSALAAACRGAFFAIKSDGSIKIFAGTSTKLYTLNNTTYAWSDVSKGASTYSALSSNHVWQFRQFNNYVIAVQQNAAPQVFDLTSSSAFDDLGGSPPNAAYIEIVGRFVVLSGLASYPYRIQWSGLNATTTWTSGVNSSDYQDFSDGGIVRGVAGGENGIVFQDQVIRRMTYVPGSPLIFQFDRVSQDKGLAAPYSIIRAGERVFFYSTQGFGVIDPGSLPTPIGRERVDRWFGSNANTSDYGLFQGAADPRSSRVYWSFRSTSGATGLFDRLLGYDYVLDKWFLISATGEVIANQAQPGLTLEGLDAIYPSIDDMTTSLDEFSSTGSPELASFTSDHKIAFFRGSNMEATLETGEQGTDGRRIFVRGFRPVTDASTFYGSASSRETQGATASDGTEASRNSTTGRCDMRVSTRYSRLKVRIPAEETWTFCAGVEPDMAQEGLR